jgi:hypothetical protein
MTGHHLGPSYPGTVVLDIGGQTGAVIVYAEPHQHGQEIHLLPVAGGPSTHAVVRPRRLGRDTVYCAVYPDLPAGDYRLLTPGEAAPTTIHVHGGAVTQLSAARAFADPAAHAAAGEPGDHHRRPGE